LPADIKALLAKFPSILSTGDVVSNPSHGVEHHIHTGGLPTLFTKACHLDLEILEIAKAELKWLESTSIVRCSTSPWA
jgi:hypothetical protein